MFISEGLARFHVSQNIHPGLQHASWCLKQLVLFIMVFFSRFLSSCAVQPHSRSYKLDRKEHSGWRQDLDHAHFLIESENENIC